MNTLALNPDRNQDMVCLIVGLGLLGGTIARYFRRFVPCSSTPLVATRINWMDPVTLASDLLNIVRNRNARHVELIWCAGKAGFFSSNAELEHEFMLFKTVVLAFARKFGSGLTVSLLSSAGGLYEESGYVNDLAQVRTTRPYGIWKLKQEAFLSEAHVTSRIFRLSSVYGFIKAKQRMGLLSVLIEHALNGGVATIYAKPTTLRDYVFNDDVARYVVQSIMEQRDPITCILASGRPTSVDFLIKLISSITNKRVQVQFFSLQKNEGDIVFANHLVPIDFIHSPLEETVRLITVHKKSGIKNI